MSAPTLELWQTEWCPASPRVRQRLTELGVADTVRRLPIEPEDGAERHRDKAATARRLIGQCSVSPLGRKEIDVLQA